MHWDCDYGCERRKGWSVVWDGSVAVEFERFMIVALLKAWADIRHWET